jgi:hypothetical protein
MITYDGKPLLASEGYGVPSPHEIKKHLGMRPPKSSLFSEWLEQNFSTKWLLNQMIRIEEEVLPYKNLLPEYTAHDSYPNWFPQGINSLCIPTGAVRYSTFIGLYASERFPLETGAEPPAGFSPQLPKRGILYISQEASPAPSKFTDPRIKIPDVWPPPAEEEETVKPHELKIPMHIVEAIALTRNPRDSGTPLNAGDKDLWAIFFADSRYLAQRKTAGDFKIDQGVTTWQELIDHLATELGWTIKVEYKDDTATEIESIYQYPHELLTTDFNLASIILDLTARSIGRRVVKELHTEDPDSPDTTYSLVPCPDPAFTPADDEEEDDPIISEEVDEAIGKAWRVGRANPFYVPESFSVIFRKHGPKLLPEDRVEILSADWDGGAAEGSIENTYSYKRDDMFISLYTTASARYTDPDADPSNLTKCEDLARVMVADYIEATAVGDVMLNGIIDYTVLSNWDRTLYTHNQSDSSTRLIGRPSALPTVVQYYHAFEQQTVVDMPSKEQRHRVGFYARLTSDFGSEGYDWIEIQRNAANDDWEDTPGGMSSLVDTPAIDANGVTALPVDTIVHLFYSKRRGAYIFFSSASSGGGNVAIVDTTVTPRSGVTAGTGTVFPAKIPDINVDLNIVQETPAVVVYNWARVTLDPDTYVWVSRSVRDGLLWIVSADCDDPVAVTEPGILIP